METRAALVSSGGVHVDRLLGCIVVGHVMGYEHGERCAEEKQCSIRFPRAPFGWRLSANIRTRSLYLLLLLFEFH